MIEQTPIGGHASTERLHDASTAASPLTRTQIKMLGIAMLGGGLEYYEFIVFGVMVPTLSRVFFSSAAEPWLSTLQTLAIFAAGYIVRPVGGMFLSRHGRQVGPQAHVHRYRGFDGDTHDADWPAAYLRTSRHTFAIALTRRVACVKDWLWERRSLRR